MGGVTASMTDMAAGPSLHGSPPRAPRAPAPLRRSAAWFVGVTAAVSASAAGLALWGAPAPRWEAIVLWTAAALVGQVLAFSTPTGFARVTLATPIHLAMAWCLAPATFLPAIYLSRTLADGVDRHRGRGRAWYRALFNTAQVSLAALVAYGVRRLWGESAPSFVDGGLVPFVLFPLMVAVYYAINVGSVSAVLSLSTGSSFRSVWLKNYGYRVEVYSTLGLALLAPLMILAHEALGAPGLLFFLVPTLFIWEASRQYAALRRMQPAMVAAERMEERRDISVEVGNEINKHLTRVYGHLQLLLRGDYGRDETQRRLGQVLGELGNISLFTKGLIDFSRREKIAVPTVVGPLVESTVECLRVQCRLEGSRITFDLDPGLDELELDPMQIQQAIRNLVLNAAEAMERQPARSRAMTVRTRRYGESGVEIAVIDNGPGIPKDLWLRALDPGFTTRPNARGMGLFTAQRIAAYHHGKLIVEAAEDGGAAVRILLPGIRRSGRLPAKLGRGTNAAREAA